MAVVPLSVFLVVRMKFLPLVCCVLAAATHAQTPAATSADTTNTAGKQPAASAEPDPSAEFFLLGLGYTKRTPVFKDENGNRLERGFPFIHYRSKVLDLTGINASYHFADDGSVRWSVHVGWINGDARDNATSTVLAGTSKREAGWWLGPSVRYKADWGQLTATIEGDAANNSNGYQARLGYSKPFRIGYMQITPSAHLRWLSDQYVNYYYGVRADEATASRPMYTPGAATAAWLQLNALVPVSRHDGFMIDYQIHQLGQSMADSPLVQTQRYERISVAYMHRF